MRPLEHFLFAALPLVAYVAVRYRRLPRGHTLLLVLAAPGCESGPVAVLCRTRAGESVVAASAVQCHEHHRLGPRLFDIARLGEIPTLARTRRNRFGRDARIPGEKLSDVR